MNQEQETGKLYIVATPIGNLEDMTLRGLRILREADLIAAEDTRVTRKLLSHYEIGTRLTSYHEHNKMAKGETILEKLREGQTIALVSDAGMPGISDPGSNLVASCREEGIPVEVIPGASASITALVLSGRSTDRFCFEGFLSRDKDTRRRQLDRIRQEERTILLYEAPHRLKETLAELAQVIEEERMLTLCKELTKRHESAREMTLAQARELVEAEPPRGEYVIVIDGRDPVAKEKEEQKQWEEISLTEHMKIYESLDRREAMRMVARDRGRTKREIYQALLKEEEK